MPNIKQITVIGNSVTLRVRPPEAEERNNNKVYGVLLEEELNKTGNWFTNNLGLSRRIVEEFHENKDLFIRTFPNYFVINLGCVDAPTREIPLWFSDIIYRRKNVFFYPVFNFIYSRLIKKYLRTQLVILRGKRPWVSPTKFQKNFSLMLDVLIKETSANIIVLGINRGNERIERSLPGTNKNYIRYDEIIKNLCSRPFVDFIDVSHLNSQEHFPDGIHYNFEGHKKIKEAIYKCIVKRENERKV